MMNVIQYIDGRSNKMHEYEVSFYANGKRTKEYVFAYSANDAIKLIEARYLGTRLEMIKVSKVHT